MKKSFVLISILLIIVIMSSCTSVKVSVSGTPGVEICDAHRKRLAIIPQSGVTVIKIDKYPVCAFLYSHEMDSVYYVPFAINYKKNRGGKYLTDQKTNQDIAFSPLVQTADYKMSLKNNPKHVDGKKRSAVKDYEKKENIKVKSEDKVIESVNRQEENRTIVVNRPPKTHAVVEKDESSIDYSNSVVGTYIGKGRILEAGEVAERFNKMTVVIKQCSDNLVKVSVKVNVLPFFRNDSRYVVSKSNGVYVLKNKDLNSTIKIDENGDMTYECRNMIERGSNGILKITAAREQ